MKTKKVKAKCPRCGKNLNTSGQEDSDFVCLECNENFYSFEVNQFYKQAVLDLIASISGCDGSDDFARGWDEACRMLYEAVERMECPGSRTRIN